MPARLSSEEVRPSAQELEAAAFPPLLKAHVDNCQFSSWHAQYRSLVPKTKVIRPIPREFLDYLLEDGIVLPPEAFPNKFNVDDEMDSDTKYEDEDEDDKGTDPSEKFKEFHQQVEQTIQELGGAVMPKLNWSAPRDAQWISTTSSLKCVSASDIYLLLKSSSYIVHDLTESYSDCVDVERPAASATGADEGSEIDPNQTFELVLRQWVSINPALEFRCFVKDRTLIGATQRDMNYFDFLEPLAENLAEEIELFFEEKLQSTFPDNNFVFDVYIPRPYNRVWLVDINPYAPRTDTHLFSWEELLTFNHTHPEFEWDLRLQEKENATRNFGGAAHSENHVPKDVVDASMSGEGIAQFARQWQQMMQGQSQDQDSDSS